MGATLKLGIQNIGRISVDRSSAYNDVYNAGWTRPADWLAMPTITSSEQKIALLMPVFPQGSNFLAFLISGAYTVDWGDGVVENFAAGVKAQHSYDYADSDLNATVTSDGYKMAVVVITPQAGQNLTSVNFNQPYAITGSTFPNSSPILEIIFSCPNLTSISLGLATVTSVFCKSLVHFSGVNMGLITNFTSIFQHLTALKLVSNLYTTATVTNTTSMFNSCRSLISVPLFDTSNVTSMASMFFNCSALVSVPLFNTSSVTNMGNMFVACSSLTTIPLFDTSNVTNISNAFRSCTSLTTIPLFNTSKVTDMSQMLRDCYSLAYVPLFDTSSVTTMSAMLYNCYALTSVPLFNTSNVTNMGSLFVNCYSLTSVPLFDTSKVTNMSGMFGSCNSLTSVPLFDTSKVTNMSGMFGNCFLLERVPLFDTSKVTNMSRMFELCNSLVSVPLFNTSAVTTMNSMFNGCYALVSVPLFDTSNVIDMSSMFLNCAALVSVPQWNTPANTTFAQTFNGCSSLTTVPLLNASVVVSPNFTNTFNSCISLARGALSGTRFTISYSGCKLSKEELESIFDNLGTIGAAGQTLTISSNWGAPNVVSLAATTTANSTTITMANTAGLETGMQITGTNSPLTTARAVTFTAGSTVTIANHGLSDGDEVSFATIVTTTGIVTNTIYYVVNTASGSFQVAASPGGAALTLTGTGSGTLRYRTEIVSITPNTSIAVSRPMVASGATTLTFRQLKTGTALLKGWAVTG